MCKGINRRMKYKRNWIKIDVYTITEDIKTLKIAKSIVFDLILI
jgi:hypothetical protein